jgi:hypothetical protein
MSLQAAGPADLAYTRADSLSASKEPREGDKHGLASGIP